MNKPNVSVLMSNYNNIDYIAEAVESILNQTYSNFEFIIYDDCSSDGSREYLREISEKDERIVLIENNDNKGLGHNLAQGVNKANGNWILRMDADDISVPNRIERLFAFLDKHPELDVLGSYASDIDEEGNFLRKRKVPLTNEKIRELVWTCPFIHPSVIFRKSSILKIGSYNPKIRKRQDYDLWFRCVKGGLNLANIPEPLLLYRHTHETFKRNNFKVGWEQAIIGWKGCWLVKAPVKAYLGVAVPVLNNSIPYGLKKYSEKYIRKIDPRKHL
jgi:glycosyltransferase involved in cell wall biosynthesis